MIALFRTNHPAVLLYLLLYTLLLKGAFLLLPGWIAPAPDSFLGFPFTILFTSLHVSDMTFQVADIVMVYLQAVLFNSILVNFNLFDRNTYIPAVLYITVSSLFGIWSVADIQTVSHFFLLFSLYNLFSLSGKEIGKENIFYTAMYLSLGSLFYFPLSLFLPVILGTLIFRGYHLSDVMLVLIGFLLPYFFIGLGFYYNDSLPNYAIFLQRLVYHFPDLHFDINIAEAVGLGYLILLSFMGFWLFMRDSDFRIIKQRRMLYIGIAFMVLILACSPFAGGSTLLYFQLLVPVSAMFLSKIFEGPRLRFYHHIYFYLLFLGSVGFELYFLHII